MKNTFDGKWKVSENGFVFSEPEFEVSVAEWGFSPRKYYEEKFVVNWQNQNQTVRYCIEQAIQTLEPAMEDKENPSAEASIRLCTVARSRTGYALWDKIAIETTFVVEDYYSRESWDYAYFEDKIYVSQPVSVENPVLIKIYSSERNIMLLDTELEDLVEWQKSLFRKGVVYKCTK